jgi:hypothetical protein
MSQGAARAIAALVTVFLGASGALYTTCGKRPNWGGPHGMPPASVRGTLNTGERPAGPHPRILLTKDRLAMVQGVKEGNGPTWKNLMDVCTEVTDETIKAGYEAWDWANGALSLSLCHRLTGNAKYKEFALKYFQAMLDDRYVVGDKKGGPTFVQHDHGYPLRTLGALGSILYDWLHEHTSPEVKKKFADRLHQWLAWFSEHGYNRDEPISNYFASYIGAVAFGGIALEGDDDRAKDLRKRTQSMWNNELVPRYRRLQGGDFTEGWQYGSFVTMVFGVYAEAEITSHPQRSGDAPPKPLYDDLPWLKQIVSYNTHALMPNAKHLFDAGDWSEKPALPAPYPMLTVAMILPREDQTGKQALWLARQAMKEKHGDPWRWLEILGDDPSRQAEDPRKGPTSYYVPGTGTFFARTDWSPAAVWTAFTSPPWLSDHQHLDAGHFEITRGDDELLIDGGGYGSFSSMSHNTVLVDDGKDTLNYSPNQGTWGDTSHIERFEDVGGIAYASSDFTSSYLPSGYPRDQPRRSVPRAERDYIFSRTPVAGMPQSARVVLYDRFTLTKGTFKTTATFHSIDAQEVKGTQVKMTRGKSSAWLTALTPGVALRSVKEPTTLVKDVPWYANEPPENRTAYRVDVKSPAGTSTERRFLHAIVVGPSDGKPPAVTRIEGDVMEGAVIDEEAYLFPVKAPHKTAEAFSYKTPASATRHFLSGLAKGAKYKLSVTKDGDACTVSVSPDGDRPASPQGTILMTLKDCALQK